MISGGGGLWDCLDMTQQFVSVCYMHDYVQYQHFLSMLVLIICIYGFPLCVLLMCLRCIIMFMHDHPFLFLNCLSADVCVCIIQVK